MTSLTFDIINNSTNAVMESGIKTFPEAQERASALGNCSVKSVYKEFEPKEKTSYAPHRLVAFCSR